MPLTTSSAIFDAAGRLAFFAELARAAYHLRVDANPNDGIDSNEWPSLLFGVDPAVDPSFVLVDNDLQFLNPADFGAAGAQLELNAGLFYTDGLQNGIYTTTNAAALVGRSQDALFISFRGTNDTLDAAQDTTGLFNVHWSEFAALRSAISSYIDNAANGIAHVYVTGHSLGAAMVQAMMIEHAGDARFEAATFASPGYMFGTDLPDARITNVANDGDVVSFVESIFRIDGDLNVFDDGLGTGLTAHSMNLYSTEAQFLRANGIDIGQIQGTAGGGDFDSFVFAAHDNGDNTFTIGLGADELAGSAAADLILGGDGDDRMFGKAGSDRLLGGDGRDTLVGNADIFAQESDILDGGNGNDTFYGEFTDTIIGGGGQDFLYEVNSFSWTIDLGATSIEWMFADFGDDTINASTQTASVEIYGSGGFDSITGSAQGDLLWAGVGNDVVVGGGGDDMLFGDLGADSLSGGDGNDRLYVDSIDTVINGGAGTDAAYITSGPGMSLNMLTSAIEFVADFAGGNDTLNGAGLTVDMIAYAGGGTDVITGGFGNDFLWGEAGADTIIGNGGGDTLVGGTGADILTGGLGTDVLYMNSGGGTDGALDRAVFTAGWGTDFVFDFVVGEDKLDLTALGTSFAALTITNSSGHAYVMIGGGPDLIAVANNGGLLTAGDFLF